MATDARVKREVRVRLPAIVNGPDVTLVFGRYDDGVLAGEVGIETGDVVTAVDITDLRREVGEVHDWLRQRG